MAYRILGLHHVTATVDDAQQDLDFCLDLLGMRLVKKTVNFDNHHVYHFYYGSERGRPGTIWTTFPYRDHGVRVGTQGAGQVNVTCFSVPMHSLDFWEERLRKAGADVRSIDPRFGEDGLRTLDPSGLQFELIASDDEREPWTGNGVGRDQAIRGLHSVTTVVHQAGASIDLLTGILGYRLVSRDGARTRVAAGRSNAGHFIDIVEDPAATAGINGLGTVHHVAMAISTAEEQLHLREDLLKMGLRVTEVRDRCYFQSIYFREPGGVLYEVATIQPGFTVDEELSSLGRALKLPPWEEAFRAEIEAGLPDVNYL